jgi:hypothetical protein
VDPPYPETLYNSIIVLLKVVCDVVPLAAHYGLYVCILRARNWWKREPKDKSSCEGGANTRLPLLGQTTASGRQHCAALGHGAAELRGGKKKSVNVSATIVVVYV